MVHVQRLPGTSGCIKARGPDSGVGERSREASLEDLLFPPSNLLPHFLDLPYYPETSPEKVLEPQSDGSSIYVSQLQISEISESLVIAAISMARLLSV